MPSQRLSPEAIISTVFGILMFLVGLPSLWFAMKKKDRLPDLRLSHIAVDG